VTRVLVVGGGGREHALCLALAADPVVGSLVCAPGNAGTEQIAEPLPLDVRDLDAVAACAADSGAEYVVIGPEVPLVGGAADLLRERGIPTFGPSAAAARLEGSKAYAKQVMAAAGVPTAAAEALTDVDAALAALDRFDPPYVVKADGLAGGKGVVVTTNRAEAERHVRDCAGLVVLESYLSGPEVSLLAVVDEGGGVHPLLPAQDAKRIGDGDTGPNTGGMGAYAPLPFLPPGFVEDVRERVLEPTVAELARRGTPFTGLLYAGLAVTDAGPQVIEFNARFGDPETQALLALLDAPLLGVLRGEVEPCWRPGAAVTVVLAAPGYPGQPRLGGEVTGLAAARADPAVVVHHAGTCRDGDGRVLAAGGRVLGITAVGDRLAAARGSAYDALARVHLPGGHARTDIAGAGSRHG